MSTDRLKVTSNERVDIEDFRFLAGEGIQGNIRQLGHKFLMEESVTKPQDFTGYILSGFVMSNPTGKQLQVTKGKAILSQRLNGTVVQGVVTTEGDAVKIVDLNSYVAGTYGIYLRFEENAGTSQGRIFWNPTGLGSEYVNSVATRYVASWAVRIESSSPGAEWLKIGEVAQADMTITDQRPFYFEGAVHNSYISGWGIEGDGGANDRNADRKTYGVQDLHTFIRAMKQCLEDIKGRGLRRWWARDIGGMNIGFDNDPALGRLSIGDIKYYLALETSIPRIWFDNTTTDDYLEYNRSTNTLSFSIEGVKNHKWTSTLFETESVKINNTITISTTAGEGVYSSLNPVTTDTYSLGSSSYRWNAVRAQTMYTDYLSVSGVAGEGVTTALIPNVNNSHDLGSDTYKWRDLFVGNHANIYHFVAGSYPDTDGDLPWGGPSLRWSQVYALLGDFSTLELQDTAGTGVNSDFVPAVDTAYNLGNSSYFWSNAYINILHVRSEIDGGGVSGDLEPRLTDTYNLGKTSNAWKLLVATTVRADQLYVTSNVMTSLYPQAQFTYSLGSAALAWNNIYAHDVYWIASHTTFDNYDDLAMIEAYKPLEEYKEITKAGEKRIVQSGDASTIPWPMLGTLNPDTGSNYMHLGDSVMFLLGAIKQLYKQHKLLVNKLDLLTNG